MISGALGVSNVTDAWSIWNVASTAVPKLDSTPNPVYLKMLTILLNLLYYSIS